MIKNFLYKVSNSFGVWFHSTPNTLYGVDLNKWRYIGYTTLSYTDSQMTSDVHGFVEKNKEENGERKFVHVGQAAPYMKHHLHLERWCMLWSAGEYDFYRLVKTKPSEWLLEYMLENFDVAWSDDTKWWVSTETVKYEKAKEKQNTPKIDTENNIVKIEFNKKDK